MKIQDNDADMGILMEIVLNKSNPAGWQRPETVADGKIDV